MRILLNFFVCLFFAFSSPCFAGIIYQDFEDNNGTPHRDNYESLPVEYGWGFNGAVVQRSKLGGTAPVHSGSYSWSATIPEGPKIQAGSAVVSRLQTYHMNLIQQCHDRLSFWVWADPSHVGDDTIMVKFFDQGLYKERGIGIWTKENQRAKYREWTHMEIYFNELPADFDLEHVDKIEFFNFYDGTYYYDDIQLASAGSLAQDAECLSEHKIDVCRPDEKNNAALKKCVPVAQE